MSDNIQSRASVGGTYPHHPLPAPSPVVREAERIIARNWRRALRRERQRKAMMAMILAYGIGMWLLSALLLAVTLCPISATGGACAVLALCFLAVALLKTWRAHWRMSFTTPHDGWWKQGRL